MRLNHVAAFTVACAFSVGFVAPAHAKEEAPPTDLAEEEPPEGCQKDWLCLKPPPDEKLHPGLADSKFKTYIVTAMLTGMFTQWLLPDEEKVPLLDSDLKKMLKAFVFPPLLLSLALIPATCCMMTGIGFVVGIIGFFITYALFAVHFLYVLPMTQIQIVNAALMRGKTGDGAPGTGSGKKLTPMPDDAPATKVDPVITPAEPAPAPSKESVKP